MFCQLGNFLPAFPVSQEEAKAWGGVYGHKKRAPLSPTFVNLKSNTMKNFFADWRKMFCQLGNFLPAFPVSQEEAKAWGGVYGHKKRAPLSPTFVNLKSNTMKNTLQRYAFFSDLQIIDRKSTRLNSSHLL